MLYIGLGLALYSGITWKMLGGNEVIFLLLFIQLTSFAATPLGGGTSSSGGGTSSSGGGTSSSGGSIDEFSIVETHSLKSDGLRFEKFKESKEFLFQIIQQHRKKECPVKGKIRPCKLPNSFTTRIEMEFSQILNLDRFLYTPQTISLGVSRHLGDYKALISHDAVTGFYPGAAIIFNDKALDSGEYSLSKLIAHEIIHHLLPSRSDRDGIYHNENERLVGQLTQFLMGEELNLDHSLSLLAEDFPYVGVTKKKQDQSKKIAGRTVKLEGSIYLHCNGKEKNIDAYTIHMAWRYIKWKTRRTPQATITKRLERRSCEILVEGGISGDDADFIRTHPKPLLTPDNM